MSLISTQYGLGAVALGIVVPPSHLQHHSTCRSPRGLNLLLLSGDALVRDLKLGPFSVKAMKHPLARRVEVVAVHLGIANT